MPEDHFVVIGNGPAGNQAAHTLKEAAPTSRVTLISRDHESCYRPHLLPDFISGSLTEEALYVCPLVTYEQQGIQLRSGQRVVDINLNQKELTLDHKEIVSFNGLIIAVGGTPRIPEPLRGYGDLMYRLKTLKDAKAWKEELGHVDTVLLMGGDLTSLGVTKALLQLKKKVLFMLNEDAFWPLRWDQALFKEVADMLTKKGVEVLEYQKIADMARVSDHGYRVRIDGQEIEVGMIGAFFGLVPDVGFLARSGLQIDRGILVDEYLNTGFEGIYATGDCAQIYHPEIRDYWVSIGHDNAVALGRIAALNLAGQQVQAEADMESIFDVQGVKVNTSWWTGF
jgi:nitrite reductase (NADH) large subunit